MIKFTNVFKAFPKGGLALKDVSFHVAKGEFAFLTGHSGAGKSTVMKLIYAEERPTSGDVRVSGYDVNEMRPRDVALLRRKLGIVFQDFRLLEDRTAEENVEILEDDAELAAEQGHVAWPHLVHVVSRNAHVARGGTLLGIDELHDGRLAGAGMPGEERELPLGHMEGDVLERQPALGEGLEDVGELDHLVPRQGLGEVRDEIIGILQSQGKSQESVRNASLCALFRRETGVRGEPRLRYERLA